MVGKGVKVMLVQEMYTSNRKGPHRPSPKLYQYQISLGLSSLGYCCPLPSIQINESLIKHILLKLDVA